MSKQISPWYAEPIMVKFLDPDWEPYEDYTEQDRPMLSGICYQDKFICACCGAALDLGYYADIELKGFEEMRWIDICEAIIGD